MAAKVPEITNAAVVLSRVLNEFAWLSNQALERIAHGGASSYIGSNLASALLEARRFRDQGRVNAISGVVDTDAD